MKVQEAYEQADVVHDDDNCTVCEDLPEVYVGEMQPVYRLDWVDRLLIGMSLFTAGFLCGMWLSWQPLALERVHEEFNNITIFEDGSYAAQTHDGRTVGGCIRGGICED